MNVGKRQCISSFEHSFFSQKVSLLGYYLMQTMSSFQMSPKTISKLKNSLSSRMLMTLIFYKQNKAPYLKYTFTYAKMPQNY